MSNQKTDFCYRLWRNAIPCDETLVVADAREDQGFDRSAEGTVVAKGGGDGSGDWDGEGDGDSDGYKDGSGNGYGEGDGWGSGFGDGDGYGDGSGSGFGVKYEFTWTPGTPYLFPNEAQEAPCEPE